MVNRVLFVATERPLIVGDGAVESACSRITLLTELQMRRRVMTMVPAPKRAHQWHGEDPVASTVPHTVDVGAALRAARERLGTSLDAIAQATKIRVPLLRAIEANRRDQLPQNVFVRALIRAYAREVGLDADVTASRYLEQFETVPDAGPTEEPSVRTPSRAEQRAVERQDSRSSSPGLRAFAILLVLVLIGYTVNRWQRGIPKTSRSEHSAAVAPVPSPDPERAVVGMSGSRSTVAQPVGGSLHVVLAATAACWVSATADGTRQVHRKMQRGEEQIVDARNEIVLRIGAPAAVGVTINGVATRPLGRASRPATVRITGENYLEYLRR